MPYCNYFCKKIIMDRRSFIKSGLLAAAVGAVAGPKAIAKKAGRMEENLAIWDFELSAEDMEQIAALYLARPQMLDPRKPSEVHRLFNYLNNPVLTSL